MAEDIVNRVAESKLITIDLEDFYPNGQRHFFDISQWLDQGIILREKDFRQQAKNHNWEQYQDSYVAIGCTTDAILPAWASLLIATHLNLIAKDVFLGDKSDLENHIFLKVIEDLDVSSFEGKPIIVKGCSEKKIPQNAYIQLLAKLQGVAKSIFYGEACSSVPLWKKKLYNR